MLFQDCFNLSEDEISNQTLNHKYHVIQKDYKAFITSLKDYDNPIIKRYIKIFEKTAYHGILRASMIIGIETNEMVKFYKEFICKKDYPTDLII